MNYCRERFGYLSMYLSASLSLGIEIFRVEPYIFIYNTSTRILSIVSKAHVVDIYIPIHFNLGIQAV